MNHRNPFKERALLPWGTHPPTAASPPRFPHPKGETLRSVQSYDVMAARHCSGQMTSQDRSRMNAVSTQKTQAKCHDASIACAYQSNVLKRLRPEVLILSLWGAARGHTTSHAQGAFDSHFPSVMLPEATPRSKAMVSGAAFSALHLTVWDLGPSPHV
jgi:hypothetical protein